MISFVHPSSKPLAQLRWSSRNQRCELAAKKQVVAIVVDSTAVLVVAQGVHEPVPHSKMNLPSWIVGPIDYMRLCPDVNLAPFSIRQHWQGHRMLSRYWFPPLCLPDGTDGMRSGCMHRRSRGSPPPALARQAGHATRGREKATRSQGFWLRRVLTAPGIRPSGGVSYQAGEVRPLVPGAAPPQPRSHQRG
jgi:hypothetical protein